MTRPLVLLSNDDGFHSPYLQGLADALEKRIEVETMIVAPERQRSATSHTITLHKPVRIIEMAANRFVVSGSPVDCVYVGIVRLAKRRPALVISGINDGYNLGFDVHYSGTVGAAREGALRGVPSMALSLAPRSPEGLPGAIDLACHLAKKILTSDFYASDPSAKAPARLLNVNIPAVNLKVSDNETPQFRITKLGRRAYQDDVHQRDDPRGGHYFWIGGGIITNDKTQNADTKTVAIDGIASVTPLSVDPTDHELLAPGGKGEPPNYDPSVLGLL